MVVGWAWPTEPLEPRASAPIVRGLANPRVPQCQMRTGKAPAVVLCATVASIQVPVGPMSASPASTWAMVCHADGGPHEAWTPGSAPTAGTRAPIRSVA